MAKFYGKVGFGETVESPEGSGVHKKVITERSYFGDVDRVSRRSLEGEKVNNDLSVGHIVRIVADDYAREHLLAIVYVEWMGALWDVPEVVEERPRLNLRLGGVYSGPKAEPSGPAEDPPG